MIQQETIEQAAKEFTREEMNRVIADFMGFIHHEDPGYDKFEINALEYSTNWNALYPVWAKFRDMSLANSKYEDWVNALHWYLYSSQTPYRLFERIFYAISWYNEHLKQKQ
jgi:hypothetical protein